MSEERSRLDKRPQQHVSDDRLEAAVRAQTEIRAAEADNLFNGNSALGASYQSPHSGHFSLGGRDNKPFIDRNPLEPVEIPRTTPGPLTPPPTTMHSVSGDTPGKSMPNDTIRSLEDLVESLQSQLHEEEQKSRKIEEDIRHKDLEITHFETELESARAFQIDAIENLAFAGAANWKHRYEGLKEILSRCKAEQRELKRTADEERRVRKRLRDAEVEAEERLNRERSRVRLETAEIDATRLRPEARETHDDLPALVNRPQPALADGASEQGPPRHASDGHQTVAGRTPGRGSAKHVASQPSTNGRSSVWT